MKLEKNLLELHCFVCINERIAPKTGCGNLGSMDLIAELKKKIRLQNLPFKLRINRSGCLGQCEKGPVMVSYPKGDWFFGVHKTDLPAVIEKLIL